MLQSKKASWWLGTFVIICNYLCFCHYKYLEARIFILRFTSGLELQRLVEDGPRLLVLIGVLVVNGRHARSGWNPPAPGGVLLARLWPRWSRFLSEVMVLRFAGKDMVNPLVNLLTVACWVANIIKQCLLVQTQLDTSGFDGNNSATYFLKIGVFKKAFYLNYVYK